MSFEPHRHFFVTVRKRGFVSRFAFVCFVLLFTAMSEKTSLGAEENAQAPQSSPEVRQPLEPYKNAYDLKRELETMNSDAFFDELLKDEPMRPDSLKTVPESVLGMPEEGKRLGKELSAQERKLSETLIVLDLHWGFGEASRWKGSVAVLGGRISHVTPLGWDADSVGAFYREKGVLHFEQRSAKRFDGFRFAVDAPLSASLSLTFEGDTLGETVEKTIPLHQLVQLRDSRKYEDSLDSFENRFELRRAAGDEILVSPLKGSLIFDPGEATELEIHPRLYSLAEEKELFLEIVLQTPSGEVVPLPAPEESQLRISNHKTHTLPIRLPFEPGVYDLELTIKTRRKPNLRLIPPPFFKEKDPETLTLAARTMQCVIADPRAKVRPQGGLSEMRTELLAQLDPTRGDWWTDWAKKNSAFESLLLSSWKNVSKSPGSHFSPAKPNEPIAEHYGNGYRGSDSKSERTTEKDSKNPWEKVRDFPKNMIHTGEKKVEQFVPSLNVRKVFDLKKEKEYAKTPPPQYGERFTEEFLARIIQEAWTDGGATNYRNALGTFVKLPALRKSQATPWALYPIPIHEPNQPHLLEIEYPSDHPQTLGISVLELLEEGKTQSLPIHSGIDVDPGYLRETGTPKMHVHRIVFWPRTELPIVLLSNQQENRSALFGTIRVHRIVSESPRRFTDSGERLFAAYFHRPCFPGVLSERFSVTNGATSAASDWSDFRDGIEQLVDSLHRIGYTGAMLNVAADGSALYPSEVFGNNPRFDSGLFHKRGEDPLRKDVLELVARTFDREELTLIPAIDFNAPLPGLEERIRREKAAWSEQENESRSFALRSGYFWVDPEGKTLREDDSPIASRGSDENPSGVIRYNILHPAVQEEMLHAVREILVRYGNHPSFGGVSIQLSPEGFSQLPEEFWGLDDRTFSLFLEETRLGENVNIAEDEHRFMKRYEFLRTEHRDTWVRWRAKKTSEFYLRMSRMISHFRADAKLYLSGAKLLDGARTQNAFYPKLSNRETLFEHLLVLGFDLSLLGEENALVFLRPEKTYTSAQTACSAVQREMEQSDSLSVFSRFTETPGSLFFHENGHKALASFERKRPHMLNVSNSFDFQIVPSGESNRRRFVRQMAKADQAVLFDGGYHVTHFDEDPLVRFIAAYRRLPQVKFQTFESPAMQPLSLRYAETTQGTFLYVLNEAPFHVEGTVTLGEKRGATRTVSAVENRISLRVTELSEEKTFLLAAPVQGNGYLWKLPLKPYDFIAVRIEDARFVPVAVKAECPGEICGDKGSLSRMRNTLVYAIQSSFEWAKLRNPGFEAPEFTEESPFSASGIGLHVSTHGAARIPGWNPIGDESFSAVLDERNKFHGEGKTSLKMKSTGSSGGVSSNTFEAPPSGRLFISFRLATSEDAEKIPLRLSLTARDRETGYPFFRTMPVSRAFFIDAEQDRNSSDTLRWHHVKIPFTRLPLDGLEELSLRLELTDSATLWIDEMRMDFIAFNDQERRAMMQVLTAAGYRQSNGNYSDAIALFESFWPQIILEILATKAKENDEAVAVHVPRVATPQLPYADQVTHPPESGNTATERKARLDSETLAPNPLVPAPFVPDPSRFNSAGEETAKTQAAPANPEPASPPPKKKKRDFFEKLKALLP